MSPIWLHGRATAAQNQPEKPRRAGAEQSRAADKNRGLLVPAEFYHLAGPADPNAPQQQPPHINAPHSSCCVCSIYSCVWLGAFRRICSHGQSVSWVFSVTRPHENMLLLSWMMVQYIERVLCECVGFIFLNIFNQIPLASLYISLLLRHCTSRRIGWYTDQHRIWIKKLCICHVTGTEWAQPNWIGASVCLIPAEEPWVQVLINGREGASPLLWREQWFVCVKHHFDTHLFKNKSFCQKTE